LFNLWKKTSIKQEYYLIYIIDRTVQALDISRSFLNKILKKEPVELNEKSVNECKDSLDSFDKKAFALHLYYNVHKLYIT
jgi:hypothetical protein